VQALARELMSTPLRSRARRRVPPLRVQFGVAAPSSALRLSRSAGLRHSAGADAFGFEGGDLRFGS
jgi:hypothetical protein